MRDNEFVVGRYQDSDTGRYRWGVMQYPSMVWYFPKRYGLKAALDLCNAFYEIDPFHIDKHETSTKNETT
jgi:hypothetical protein